MVTRSTIVSALKCITIQKTLSPSGESLHAQIIKSGLLPDTQLLNHLLNMYAKTGSPIDARKVFDDMPQRNLVSWSAMISGYSQSGFPQSALELITHMHKEGFNLNQFIFSSLIKACSSLKSINRGKQIHAQVIVSGFDSDQFAQTSLIDMYSKFGHLDCAIWIFDGFDGFDQACDPVMYNSMIAGFVSSNFEYEALELFMKFLNSGFKPTESTFGSVIKACLSLGRETGEQIHCCTVKNGFDCSNHVGTALVDMYAKFGDMKSSKLVFDRVQMGDLPLWNALIVGYSQNVLAETVLEIFVELKSEGFDPNGCTFSSVLKACTVLKYLKLGKLIHGYVHKSEFQTDLAVNTTLIDFYMKCGFVEESDWIFKSMSKRNTVSFNSMISGYAQNRNFDGALKLFIDIYHQSLRPNQGTFVALLTPSLPLRYEKCIHPRILKHGFGLDLTVQNALLDVLIKREAIDEAHRLFDEICEKNVVSWTTILSGLSQLGFDLDALKVFNQMQLSGIKPNNFTFATILKACGTLASLEQGKCIHGYLIKHGAMDEDFTNSALLDMYAKCGALEESCTLFNKMPKGDVVSWNAMITGFAQHGLGGKALELFEKMQQNGVEPNLVTFISLLSACSHGRLVHDGVRIFNSMTQKHGLVPSIDHYACMVDLFGRAGLLDRAKKLIDGIPLKGNALIWTTFLQACKLHGNIELAELARNNILDLGDQDNSTLTLISNMYSEAGKWDRAEKVRKRMREKGMRKDPGVSWVEIKGASIQ